MKTEDIITPLFCPVDERMKWIKKHPDSTLYPSELVTLGALFAHKGGGLRRVYGGLKRAFSQRFPRLPAGTRAARVCGRRRACGQLVCAPL